MKKTIIGLIAFVVVAAAAAQEPPKAIPLPAIDRLPENHKHGGKLRDTTTINMIVIHTIGGPKCEGGKVVYTKAPQSAVYWRDDFEHRTDASIHYVVDREGKIAQQRPENRTAGHVSSEVDPAINARSIGIEMTNTGDGVDPFPEAQVAAMAALVKDIASRYRLGPDAIRAHSELDTRMLECAGKPFPRKTDPGPLFPMDRIRAALTTPN